MWGGWESSLGQGSGAWKVEEEKEKRKLGFWENDK